MSDSSLFTALAGCLAEDDRDKANKLLFKISSRKLEEDDLLALFLMLDDISDDIGNMYGIIHVAEKASPDTFYNAFASSFPQLSTKSPQWARFVVARHLAASPNNRTGFEASRFLNTMQRSLNETSKLNFRSICAELRIQGKLVTNTEYELLD